MTTGSAVGTGGMFSTTTGSVVETGGLGVADEIDGLSVGANDVGDGVGATEGANEGARVVGIVVVGCSVVGEGVVGGQKSHVSGHIKLASVPNRHISWITD